MKSCVNCIVTKYPKSVLVQSYLLSAVLLIAPTNHCCDYSIRTQTLPQRVRKVSKGRLESSKVSQVNEGGDLSKHMSCIDN